MGCGMPNKVLENNDNKNNNNSNVSLDKINSIGKLSVFVQEIRFFNEDLVNLIKDKQFFMTVTLSNQIMKSHLVLDKASGRHSYQPNESQFDFVINKKEQDQLGRILHIQLLSSNRNYQCQAIVDLDPYLKRNQLQSYFKQIEIKNKKTGQKIALIKLKILFIRSEFKFLSFKLNSVTLRSSKLIQKRFIYIKIIIGQDIFQSKPSSQNQDMLPQWQNQVYTFIVPNFLKQGRIQVYDKSNMHKLVGFLDMSLEIMLEDNMIQTYYQELVYEDFISGTMNFYVKSGLYSQNELKSAKRQRKVTLLNKQDLIKMRQVKKNYKIQQNKQNSDSDDMDLGKVKMLQSSIMKSNQINAGQQIAKFQKSGIDQEKQDLFKNTIIKRTDSVEIFDNGDNQINSSFSLPSIKRSIQSRQQPQKYQLNAFQNSIIKIDINSQQKQNNLKVNNPFDDNVEMIKIYGVSTKHSSEEVISLHGKKQGKIDNPETRDNFKNKIEEYDGESGFDMSLRSHSNFEN